MSNRPILDIHIDSKKYASNQAGVILDDVRLQIHNSEFVCLVGPSGCGKSTLLNIIAGLDCDYEGSVLYQGKPVTGTSQDRILIFQELGLFPWLNVEDNVAFGLRLKGVAAPQRRDIARQHLNMVGLSKFSQYFIHELSGGMKQKVALARALAMEPKVLLMDEPFAALDAQTRDMLHQELQNIWQRTKTTIVFVTHNVREAVCLGDRVVVLSHSPAKIKASFDIRLPRPRQIESAGLIELVRPILTELKFEIERNHG